MASWEKREIALTTLSGDELYTYAQPSIHCDQIDNTLLEGTNTICTSEIPHKPSVMNKKKKKIR